MKIAIIHRVTIRDTIELMEELARNLGYDVGVMYVNSETNPQNVADFVTDDKNKINLALLAESFGELEDSFAELDDAYSNGDWRAIKQITDWTKKGEGIDAIVKIRETSAVPVYLISGNLRHEQRAMEAGANGYLRTPIEVEYFKNFLKEL